MMLWAKPFCVLSLWKLLDSSLFSVSMVLGLFSFIVWAFNVPFQSNLNHVLQFWENMVLFSLIFILLLYLFSLSRTL